MKNLPNQITVSRVVLISIFVFFANLNTDNKILSLSEQTVFYSHLLAYIIAIVAGLTDLLDGYLARRLKAESDFGRLMDPLADKIFILATFIMMADYNLMPAWIVIVILTREFMVTGLRMLASSKGVIISADKWGKCKTALQMTALAIGGFAWVTLSTSNPIELKANDNPWIWGSWYTLLLIVTAVTIYSGVGYYVKNKNIFMGKD